MYIVYVRKTIKFPSVINTECLSQSIQPVHAAKQNLDPILVHVQLLYDDF